MMIEQIVRLPSPSVDDFSVQVQIQILPSGDRYMGFLSIDMGMFYNFSIGLKPHDVEDLNVALQQTLERVSNDLAEEGDHSDALFKLAEKGSFAFKKVFADSGLRQLLSSVLKMGAVVQIPSDDFFIPWELLYTGSLDDKVDITRFWGMQNIISRTIIQDDRPGDYVSPVIHASCPHVGLIAYTNLEHVATREIPALQKLDQDKRIQLFSLHPMDSSRRMKELADFDRFLRENVQIVHFACHAREGKPLSQSFLLVSDEFSITIEDFYTREFVIEHNPLVILNACLTGTINPLYTSNWVTEFWKRGARGVLATELHMPDWFAAAFIEEFYRHLLRGESIGEAVLATRSHFWQTEHNPLGLAYALYSSPSIKIVSSD